MLYFENITTTSLDSVLNFYDVTLQQVARDLPIPHSYWGSPEAGRKRNQLFARFDTPVHSILHELGHFICMPNRQRILNHIDAAGGVMEENATCYLQILLSDYIDGFDRTQHMSDMDDWDYSFRLGSAKAWFYEDAQDAKDWLVDRNIINQHGNITWEMRQ